VARGTPSLSQRALGRRAASPASSLSLLAFFLGLFGAHRFYAGKIGTGIIQLLITLSGIGMIVSGIWVLIDWIVILCGNFNDDQGCKITRWDN
jgi:TM2 domain-containing membrane protein YozV